MTVEIRKAKEALFYLQADLKWLNAQINDERAQGFQAWVDKLDFGVPVNLKDDIAAYQKGMAPYFDPLLALRDKLQAEIEGLEKTIADTEITVTDEVKRYVREDPPDEKEPPDDEGPTKREP